MALMNGFLCNCLVTHVLIDLLVYSLVIPLEPALSFLDIFSKITTALKAAITIIVNIKLLIIIL